ncbi:anthranilate synthase component II [Flocculibacter collagenilyticus]|uniref:anthranilate synthase component II n=1 Tax=Flocculibacter collagenilyticus TaxID=2744479 RepID=UPI0018F2F1ED|nr:aminodeoxychorismate/anthranilate synthase component II [Flocculibacter collagenilyticus]
MILMIDNYDSFTFNLVHYVRELGERVVVKRNDEVSIQQIEQLNPNYIMISPGPCSPNESGISLDVIKQFSGRIPLLGVCLGHQAIGQVFGANVIKAKQVMHGKTSVIKHNSSGVFQGLNNPLTVTRYHSLVIENESLPDQFDVTAWTETPEGSVDEIMAIKHQSLPIEGVQFHPEAILTEQGHQLLQNFIQRYA